MAINQFPPATGGGAVDSVNAHVGVVVLTAGDVGAETADATILKSANIGVSVEGYDTTILKNADIGVSVQAYDSDLTSWAAIPPIDKQNTLVSTTNIKTINGSSVLGAGDLVVSGSAAWGSVTGTLSSQTDLQTALDGKQASGTYATGTGSASGTNTGDNATNTQYSGLVSNATHTGDATGATALTVVRINGVLLSGLATGLLKNTTGTGVPSIAVNSDLPVMTATVGGAVPTPPNNTTTFLRGDGTFAAPTASVAWGGITGTLSSQSDLQSALDGKQATLVSATNIKTINGSSVLGAGNLVVSASATGVLSDLQMSILQSDGTLNAALGVQTWAGTNKTAQDVFTVAANSTYRVRGRWIVNTGATTHTTAMAFALATATVTDFQYQVLLWNAALNGIATVQSTVHASGVASKVMNATSALVFTNIYFEGIMVVGTGGTVTPQINFSANPTGTNLMKRGSWISYELLGANTGTTIGGWA